MANVIKHKRGSGSDPTASDLVVGEVAIRTDVGKLFTKMDNGSVAEIAGGGSDIAINTLSSSSATGGGSATFNGSAYRFTLSAPPNVSAAQLLVSINGVIQKPVAGTGQPSEGFSVDGTDIILGDAPATGSDFFILTFKSLGVSEPADNSVTSAKIVDGTIVNADINASAAIAGTKISPDFGSQNIATTGTLSITSAAPQIFLTDSNANSDYAIVVNTGQFRIRDETNSANRLAVNSDGHVDIYGRLDVEGGIQIPVDNQKLQIGASQDLQIYHDGSNSFIKDGGTGSLKILSNQVQIIDANNSENIANFNENGAVELYFNNSKKFETNLDGVKTYGDHFFVGTNGNAVWDQSADNFFHGDNVKASFGNANDLQIYHDGSHSYIEDSGTGVLHIATSSLQVVNAAKTEFMMNMAENGAVELYFNNSKKLKTITEGIKVTELQIAPSGTETSTLMNFGGGGLVTNSNSYGHFYDRSTGGTNTTAVMFRSAGSQVGKIFFNNTETIYSSGSSDKTLKKNFENWTETILTSFKNLNPQKFNFLQEENTDAKHKGFIAQDLADQFSEAYPIDPETNKYVFNPSGMVVYLMKAVQELTAKVEALEAK